MKADTYNLKNEVVSTVELPERIFGAKWNADLVKQVLDAQIANQRDPWAHVRDRSEVRGGGIKPWRQKGTGRARHGSTRSPLWRHGGKAHGPRNDKDYSQKVNKKMKQGAFFAALSKKFKDGEVKFFENFDLEAPKTKILTGMLRPMLPMKKGDRKYDVLLVAHDGTKRAIFRASANIPKAKAVAATSLDLFEILNHGNIFIEKDAVAVIQKHYSK
jgi:large subunit ribosomal protein L4